MKRYPTRGGIVTRHAFDATEPTSHEMNYLLGFPPAAVERTRA
jgi:hypothetical protein